MPVVGTPVTPPTESGVSCSDQLVASAVISTTVNNENVQARMRAISVQQGQAATVQWLLTNTLGDPVNLTTCSDATVEVRIREVLSFDQANPGVTIQATILDPTTGLVEAALTMEVVTAAGISFMEWGVLDTDSNLLFSNVCYLIVNRGQYGPQGGQPYGPPTIPEIRLHLRDSDPADNLWLGIQEFDYAEIAACIQRPLDYFNDSQPPLHQRYCTANFPFRYYWLEGTISCLYRMAALHYTRVHLPYQQQGGLMVDDKNKAKEYDAIAQQKWQEYKDWVRLKKVEINAWGAVQGISSPYAGAVWGPNRRL